MEMSSSMRRWAAKLLTHAKVLKRAAWILRQQRQFEDYAPPTPLPRRYVSGESYRYLGRQYQLKVVEDMSNGRF